MLNVCETLQEEVIALFDQTRHSLASGSAPEDKDSMETDDCPRPRHKDQRDGVREGGSLRSPEPCGLRPLWEALGEAPGSQPFQHNYAGIVGQEGWTPKTHEQLQVSRSAGLLCLIDPWLG